MGKIRLDRGSDLVRLNLKVERTTYEMLIKLKIAEGDGSSFTKWLNKKFIRIVNDNSALIKGYEVDNSDFE